jgi:hypothetical protein
MSLRALSGPGQAEPVPARGRPAGRRLPPAAVAVRTDRLVRHPALRAARRWSACCATTSGAALPADDLCLRAARLLQTASGTALGVDITIENACLGAPAWAAAVPMRPAVLLALNRLWGLHWPRRAAAGAGTAAGRRRTRSSSAGATPSSRASASDSRRWTCAAALCGGQASCVGESPSWSRHRILIPTCEGSSPSSPAKHLPCTPPRLPDFP